MNIKWKEAGFALPIAILVMLITTGAVLTTLNQGSTERRLVDSEAAGTEALMMAEAALEQPLTNWQAWGWATPPIATYDSTRLTFTNGFADVTWTRLRPEAPGIAAVYLIRSRGVYTLADYAGASTATRVVTRYAIWQRGTLDVRAAWTGLGGIHKNGGAGSISGVDACGVNPPVAGVSVPTAPGYTQQGGASVPTGTPPIAQIAATPAAAADSINIDWAGILSGESLPFDVVIAPGPWPSFANPNYWPVIFVNNPGGNFSLPSDGRGTLIVRGSLTIGGSMEWDGVVLVGNNVTANGTQTVEGAIVTGLNLQLGEATVVDDIANGVKNYRYNSCKVLNALNPMSRIRIFNNTWFDGWALY